MHLVLWPYIDSSESEVLNFIAEHSWPTVLPQRQVYRFFHELVSSSRLIFDVIEEGERVAVACLVDKIQNPSNDASLEFLAKRSGVDPRELLALVLPIAKERLPVARSGFSLGFPIPHSELTEITMQHGLRKHYEMFEMLCMTPRPSAIENDGVVEVSVEADEEDLYSALLLSFRENPYTSIPSYQDLSLSRQRNPDRKTYVKRVDGKIVGFLHLDYSGTVAEIQTLGVLPDFRGQGIAGRLLSCVLKDLPATARNQCVLTLAAQNKGALHLYEKVGFEVVDQSTVFRWGRDR